MFEEHCTGASVSVYCARLRLKGHLGLTCHIMKSLRRFTSLVRMRMSRGGESDFCVERLPNKRPDVISLFEGSEFVIRQNSRNEKGGFQDFTYSVCIRPFRASATVERMAVVTSSLDVYGQQTFRIDLRRKISATLLHFFTGKVRLAIDVSMWNLPVLSWTVGSRAGARISGRAR